MRKILALSTLIIFASVTYAFSEVRNGPWQDAASEKLYWERQTNSENERKEDSQDVNNTVAVFPFQNDNYGVTEYIIDKLIGEGYRVVERQELYRVFDEMKLQMSGITEYEVIKVGKVLNARYIITGTAYTIVKEYIPPPPPPPQHNYPAYPEHHSGDIFETLNARVNSTNISEGFIQEWKRGEQERKAGTFLYASLRWIDVNTGEVVRSQRDVFIKKY